MNTWKKALEQAFQVNTALPSCPVTRECALKYPRLDLLGKHSIIDTAFAYRSALIEIACQSQPEEVSRETGRLLEAARPQEYGMRQAASMLHTAELAAVLFDLSHSPEYRDMRKRLLELPVLKEYHKALTAAEHMAGLRDTEISASLKDFCSENLGHPFPEDIYRQRRQISLQEAENRLPQAPVEHREICQRYADPAVLKTVMR